MLKITEVEEIWWPVTVYQPRPGGRGGADKVKIEVLYKLLTRSEASAMQDGGDEKIAEHILDWRGDISLPFSEEALALALDKPWIFDAFVSGLADASRGGRAKN